ncbi:MAG: TetR/AcrR family transcriptional regulator [Candidatus Aminicenantales bacterium]
MSPKEITFDRKTVLDAATALVRRKGWEALTARGIAAALGSSVAPVYSAYGSMESLQRETLREARRMLHERATAAYTEEAFLNIGVGLVIFARDETNLFSALFLRRHTHQDIIEDFLVSTFKSMKADPFLKQLSDASLRRLLANIELYTVGLATAIAFGKQKDTSTAVIIQSLRNAGNMMIHGEVSGLADSESPESAAIWDRILKAKKIVLPRPEKPARGKE